MNQYPINIFFILERIGPYHNSRFNKLSQNKELKINVLETNHNSKTYPWDKNYNNNYKVFNEREYYDSELRYIISDFDAAELIPNISQCDIKCKGFLNIDKNGKKYIINIAAIVAEQKYFK